jgi:hypothetical protein
MQPQVAQPGTDVAQAPTGEHTLSPVVGALPTGGPDAEGAPSPGTDPAGASDANQAEVVEQELNSLSGTFHEALLSYKEIIADLRSSRYF